MSLKSVSSRDSRTRVDPQLCLALFVSIKSGTKILLSGVGYKKREMAQWGCVYSTWTTVHENSCREKIAAVLWIQPPSLWMEESCSSYSLADTLICSTRPTSLTNHICRTCSRNIGYVLVNISLIQVKISSYLNLQLWLYKTLLRKVYESEQ